MKIDKKRVVQLVACIATLIAFAMSIPQAIDSHRRHKKEQTLQLEELTLHFSTPATTDEQKAILEELLNNEYERPWDLHNPPIIKTIILEPTAYCSKDLFKKATAKNIRPMWESSLDGCSEGLVRANSVLTDYTSDRGKIGHFASDLYKANRAESINPYLEIGGAGSVFASTGTLHSISFNLYCVYDNKCWKSLQSEFPNVEQYKHVSRAIISNNRLYALIYVGTYTRLSSGGSLVLLRYRNSQWKVKESLGVWGGHPSGPID